MAIAMVALLGGLWAGLLRLGFSLPSLPGVAPVSHGPLMVSGFLGTLIGLERSVALSVVWRSRWIYLGPALSALGAIAVMTGMGAEAGSFLLLLGSLALALLFGLLYRRQPAPFTFVLLLGAICWVIGNGLWLAGRPVSLVVWWWSGFLIVTIAGERLELSRLTGVSPFWKRAFTAILVTYLASLIITVFDVGSGTGLAGAAMVLLAAWLLRNDIARKTIRQTGLPRFVAVCLLTGYAWLAISGVLAILFAGASAGLQYDAVLHSLFLGFVMVMIFAHAPIIFPSVLGLPVTFLPGFYVHLILLQVSLVARIFGDLLGWLPGRQWGGALNVAVLLLFLANTVRSTRVQART
jgi:hypothetical protein